MRVVDVTARTLAAALGGYVMAALTTSLLPYLLPLRRDEGVQAATLASFAIYAAVVIAVFAARSTRRVWTWLLSALAVLGGALLVALNIAGRL